ncbi:MAG: radical SAM protein [Acetatifactor sp.]|nr:radical SAM protein [Acetatifactor sp.]
MKNTRRERKYAETNFNEVLHTTLNPEGPGVVRIHMIPPKYDGGQIGESVAIINGQDIVPVNVSWSILLAEFIREVNRYSGREITDEEAESIMTTAAKKAQRVYPFVSKKRLKNDIYRIMNAFKQVAYRETVDETIGYMTMGEYAPYMRAPHRMDLMVSAMTKEGKWHCNQQCVHCYAAGQKQAEEAELTTKEWMKIIDKCRVEGIPQLTFTGGEPTMREDLVLLIEHAKWFVTRLNTNGIRVTKELCEKLKAASLDSMQITFYSCDAEVHNKLVGAAKFEDTVKGIENALEAGISVSINTPLCTLNKDYVKTLAFLHEKGVQYVTCSGLITTGNALNEASEQLQLSTEEIKAVLKGAAEYCFANGMEISFTSPGWVEDSFCEELGIVAPTCGACLSNMAITPAGNVVPCQSWLSGDVLGNMLTDDWKTIWESENCTKRREYSANMLGLCPLRRMTDEKND